MVRACLRGALRMGAKRSHLIKSMSRCALNARYESDTREPTGAVMIQLQCSVTIAAELLMASNGVEISNEPERVTRVTDTPGRQRRLGGGRGDADVDAERDWDDVSEEDGEVEAVDVWEQDLVCVIVVSCDPLLVDEDVLPCDDDAVRLAVWD